MGDEAADSIQRWTAKRRTTRPAGRANPGSNNQPRWLAIGGALDSRHARDDHSPIGTNRFVPSSGETKVHPPMPAHGFTCPYINSDSAPFFSAIWIFSPPNSLVHAYPSETTRFIIPIPP